MFYNTFKEFEAAVSVFIDQENHDEALYILKSAQELLPKNEYEGNCFYIMFIVSVIYSRQNKADECISMIKSAISQGFCFPLNFRTYNFIRQHKDYETTRHANEAVLEEARKNSSFKYKVFLPKNYDADRKYPLFICLHGDAADGYISYHSSYWRSDVFLQRGYIAVYPQSSQMYCYNGFGWLPDPELSRQEIKGCYMQLLKDYSIDESNVIIGGFSGGATTSLDIALSSTIPARGFIALCPGDNISTNIEEAKDAAAKGMKGVILEGEQERDEGVQHLLKVFSEAKLPCKYVINENTPHWYPDDLDEKLIECIDFINGQSS